MNAALLRSALYMPGANRRAMEKARDLPADALIFDLEDAVAPDMKETARAQVLAQLAEGGYGHRQLVVRANGIDSPWGEADLQALGAAGVERVNLPKIESAEQLQRCVSALEAAGAPGHLRVWAMIETPRGVANADEIACGSPRLEALLMGTTDLAHELRLPPRQDRLGLLYALSRCVNAARIAGISCLDSVYLDIGNPRGFREDCEQGRALGFDGKTLIHPGQLEAANEVFGLSEAQVLHAARVIEAWQDAGSQGKGVAVLDGKLVETMHVDDARRILALAESQEKQ